MLSKTIEFLSMSLVAHKEGGFSLLSLLFGVVSGSFKPVLALYGLFRIVPLFRSDDVTECFDLQIYYKTTSCRLYYKIGIEGKWKKRGHYIFWQLTPWFIPDLPGGRQFALRNSWDVELLLELKERRNQTPHKRCICVTCKLVKQLRRGVSCT